MKNSILHQRPTVNARAAVLSFVRAYLAKHDDSPSLGEIAVNVRSTKPRVVSILAGLERDGELIRLPGAARRKRRIILPEQQTQAPAILQAFGWQVKAENRSLDGHRRTARGSKLR